MTGERDFRRDLPSVDRVLRDCQDLVADWGAQAATGAIRDRLQELRQAGGAEPPEALTTEGIVDAAALALRERYGRGLRPVINLTGVVLHTNLGRACLPSSAAAAAARAAMQPNNLEFDLASGKRGSRDSHVESLICELTGAEAATVVNNNAAAVVLALNTLARDQEVPVSRGELVEIGGSFRMPEVMASSGCTLVEVGATNRTHPKDYRAAISERTALLMKVHTSNYRLEGFTQSVDERALAQLAHEHDLPCLVDLGSGCLVDFAALGLPAEPRAADYIAGGVDLITFSGDKLLGGPQCGIIAGRRDLVQRINSNPLKRALRLDSMILAALAEVLKLYRHPERLTESLPTLRQLTRPVAEIEAQADRIGQALAGILPGCFSVETRACLSQIGSGALPVETIPSHGIAIVAASGRDRDLRQLAELLRDLPLPVIGRLNDGELLLDLRCLEDEEPLLEQLPVLGERLTRQAHGGSD
jgi:L-seryl-tRNA(Ser) seleniumtransferase